jgi:N-acetylmuramoyl-L-alanine amidase
MPATLDPQSPTGAPSGEQDLLAQMGYEPADAPTGTHDLQELNQQYAAEQPAPQAIQSAYPNDGSPLAEQEVEDPEEAQEREEQRHYQEEQNQQTQDEGDSPIKKIKDRIDKEREAAKKGQDLEKLVNKPGPQTLTPPPGGAEGLTQVGQGLGQIGQLGEGAGLAGGLGGAGTVAAAEGGATALTGAGATLAGAEAAGGLGLAGTTLAGVGGAAAAEGGVIAAGAVTGPIGWVIAGGAAIGMVVSNEKARLFLRNLIIYMVCAAISVIAIVIGLAQSGLQGDKPTGVAVGSGSGLIAGKEYKELAIRKAATYNGSQVQLTLGNTSGKFSHESNIRPDGTSTEDNSTVALWGAAEQSTGFDAQSYADYFVTARWPVRAIAYASSPEMPQAHGFPKPLVDEAAYAGQRILIWNVKKQIGVIGVALEYGPQPWTGEHQDSEQYKANKAIWDKGANDGWRVTDPPGWGERVVGGGDKLSAAIGDPDPLTDPVIYGFATGDLATAKPGTIVHSITPVAGVDSTTNGSGFTVCVDAGHGGAVGPGAEGSGLHEEVVSFEVADALGNALRAKGYGVDMVRPSEVEGPTNPQRAKQCNADSDVAIHLHADEGGGSSGGFSIYEPNKTNALNSSWLMTEANVEKSRNFAAIFHTTYAASITSSSDMKDKGVYQDYQNWHCGLDVSNDSTIPTLLLEMFYMDNAHDADFYKNGGKDKIVTAIVAGIDAYKSKMNNPFTPDIPGKFHCPVVNGKKIATDSYGPGDL